MAEAWSADESVESALRIPAFEAACCLSYGFAAGFIGPVEQSQVSSVSNWTPLAHSICKMLLVCARGTDHSLVRLEKGNDLLFSFMKFSVGDGNLLSSC